MAKDEKLNDLIERVARLEESSKNYPTKTQALLIGGPFVAVGAVIIIALGYYDIHKIPVEIERSIQAEISVTAPPLVKEIVEPRIQIALETALSEIPSTVTSQVNADLRKIVGPEYRDILSGLRNIQVGSVTLPHKERTTGNKWEEVERRRVEFKRSFTSPPQVLLSISTIESYYRQSTRTISITTDKVGEAGFDLVVSSAYNRSLSSLTVDWIAIDPVFGKIDREETEQVQDPGN